jgi:hypothetical protein
MGDEEKLKRAFSNILDNAIKYNFDGGKIEISAGPCDAGWSVTVANTGACVSEDDIPRIFDQFYRVEKSRSTDHGGSGLGLAIVKRVVELHGGTVDFESQQKGWSKITVLLPRSPKVKDDYHGDKKNKRKKRSGLISFFIITMAALIAGYVIYINSESDQVIRMDDLPVLVKALAKKETAGCKILKVEKETKGIDVIYVGTYDQNGIEMEIEYTSDGIMIYKGKE